MVLHWNDVEDYSHGFLVAPLAALLRLGATARSAPRSRSIRAGGACCRWRSGPLALTVGRLGTELTSMRSAYILTLMGLVLLIARQARLPDPALPALLPVPDGAAAPVAGERGGLPAPADGGRLGGATALPAEHPGAARGQHHPPAHTQLFVAEACSGLALADGADHARHRLRVLLPQELVRAPLDRRVGDSDRDRRERGTRRRHRDPHLQLRAEGRRRRDPRDPGHVHFRGGVPAAARRGVVAVEDLARCGRPPSRPRETGLPHDQDRRRRRLPGAAGLRLQLLRRETRSIPPRHTLRGVPAEARRLAAVPSARR